MNKVGRNDPCPCGNGKKYKKCHGAVARPEETKQQKPSRTTNASLDAMGLPGLTQHIITVNRFRDPSDPRNQSGPAGRPGKYKVIFVFSRPGFPLQPEMQYSFSTGLKGNSHLAITRPAYTVPENAGATQIRIYGQTPQGVFEFDGYPNERGFLGKIVLESIAAASFEDAELQAYRILAPTLSNWSLQRDIPLHIYQIESVELATGNTRMSLVNQYLETPWAMPGEGTMSDEFRRYASLYREALNSNTPVYQFLCFYKIIEGIQARRNRVNAAARKDGREPKRYEERIPINRNACVTWLKAIFYGRPEWDPMSLDAMFRAEILGRKISYVVKEVLQPLRNSVAHAILDSGEPALLADEHLDTQKITKWLPLTKCIARRMLKNEFPAEFLPFLGEDGTIRGS